MGSEERFVMISSDCHAGAPPEVYREYLDRKYWDVQAEYIESARASQAKSATTIDVFGVGKRKQWETSEEVMTGGVEGVWDAAVRVRELDREGVAAEVIFPDGPNKNPTPFGVGFNRPRVEASPELQAVGAHAHNRWLADLCATHPGRHAGVAIVMTHDIADAVNEVEWARKAGLSGGILLPNLHLWTDESESFYHHPRYEPLWSACEDLDMPVHTHTSSPHANYGDIPGSRWMMSIEGYWNANRLYPLLVWGGVLERHPKLKVVMTESGGGTVPYLLWLFDKMARERNPEAVREIMSLRPSEYWARQCYVGASPPSGRIEVESRHTIGVRNIMWGSDYPHLEGTWPRSHDRIREMFAGVSTDEFLLMVGENAAAVYGFDLELLRPIADRIGPTAEDLGLVPAAAVS